MNFEEVLIKPIFTKKANRLKTDNRQITLKVATWASKHQIKAAANFFFGVTTKCVRVLHCRGKKCGLRWKRGSKSRSMENNFKKAILSIKEGTDFNIFGSAALT